MDNSKDAATIMILGLLGDKVDTHLVKTFLFSENEEIRRLARGLYSRRSSNYTLMINLWTCLELLKTEDRAYLILKDQIISIPMKEDIP